MSAVLNNGSLAGATYYKPIYDDDKEIIKENVFTNILNILGYIPGISTISGVARIIFATIMFHSTPRSNDSLRYYGNHNTRGMIEMSPVLGNLSMMITDISVAILLYNENNSKEPIVKDTESLYNY